LEFVNFEEAKKRLGKTDEQLQELIKKGEIRAFRDEGTWKFRKEDIDTMTGPAAPAKGAAGEEEAGDTLMSIDADILFAEEEEVPADSAAETWIAADTESVFPGSAAPGEEPILGVEEAMTAPEAEPAPLALSPETDESSLQEVLSDEELAPSGEGDVFAEEPVIAVDSESGLASVISTGSAGTSGVAPSRTRIVTLVEPPAHHGGFTVLLGFTVLALAITVAALMALLTGNRYSFINALGEGDAGLYVIAGGVVISVFVAILGWVLEKQRARREALGG